MRQPPSPFNVIYVNGLSCLFDEQQFARLTSMMHIGLLEARLRRGKTVWIWKRLWTLSVVAIGRNLRRFMFILLWREAGRPIQMSIQIERLLCSLVNSIGNKIGLIQLMLPWEIRTKPKLHGGDSHDCYTQRTVQMKNDEPWYSRTREHLAHVILRWRASFSLWPCGVRLLLGGKILFYWLFSSSQSWHVKLADL